MDAHLDRELKKLIVGTNDQRRRVGQAVFHLYRTLVFWHDKGRGLRESVRAWSASGAAIFDSMATTLEDLEPYEEDASLRAWLSEVLRQLGEDVDRGEHMLMPFLRWLEGRFPPLTTMMQGERTGSRIYDIALARALTATFRRAAIARDDEVAKIFRDAASRLVSPAPPASRRAR